MGFARQEDWSGVPWPSPRVHENTQMQKTTHGTNPLIQGMPVGKINGWFQRSEQCLPLVGGLPWAENPPVMQETQV